MKVRPAQYSVLLIIEANPGHSQAAIGQTLERRAGAACPCCCTSWNGANGSAGAPPAAMHARIRLHLTADGEKALVKIKSLAEQHEARLAEHVGAKRHMQLMDLLRDFG